jgi:L-fuculose-phosphate aldolase
MNKRPLQISQELKDEIARSGPMLISRGLSPGRDFGDTSLRDPRTGLVYILPRPSPRQPICDWNQVTSDDVAIINIDGEIVGDPDILPTVEAPMHLRIYQARADVHAIVHSHGEWSSIFAGVRQNIPAVTLDALETIGVEEILCAAYARIGTSELGNNVVQALGKKAKAALMANHGAICVGTSLDEAFLVAHLLEKVSMQVVFGRILGNPVPITWEDFGDSPTYEDMVPRI